MFVCCNSSVPACLQAELYLPSTLFRPCKRLQKIRAQFPNTLKSSPTYLKLVTSQPNWFYKIMFTHQAGLDSAGLVIRPSKARERVDPSKGKVGLAYLKRFLCGGQKVLLILQIRITVKCRIIKLQCFKEALTNSLTPKDEGPKITCLCQTRRNIKDNVELSPDSSAIRPAF